MNSPTSTASSTDLADWQAARRVAPYGDDHRVGELTDAAVATGMAHLQVHRLAADDEAHMRALSAVFDPPAGARVLDVGCGIGAPAQCLRQIRPDLDITLLSVSPAQLARCPPFRRICADFHAIPVAAGSFDAAMVLYAMGHALLADLFAELQRVLVPGGVLFIWDIAAEDPGPVIAGVGYKPHPVAQVRAAAAAAEFILDRWMIPRRTDDSQFIRLCGAEAYARLFAAVVPIAWRFVRA